MQYDLFGPEVLGLEAFASKETTRYSLTGIRIEPGRAIASNGKVMLVVPTRKTENYPVPDNLKPIPEEGLIVPPSAIKKAFGFVNKKSIVEDLRGVVAAVDPKKKDQAVFYGTDLELAGTVNSRLIEGTYPDVKEVFPKGKVKQNIVLSADLLKDLTTYVSKYGHARERGIRFSIRDKSTTVEVAFKLPDDRIATGLICPMNVPADAFGPTPEVEEPEKSPEEEKEALEALKDVVDADKKAEKKQKPKGKKEAA